MRLALAALLVVHGAIHVLGFVKPWRLAQVSALSGRTLVPLSETAMRGVGLGWLAACALCIVAAVLLLSRSEAWWAAAAAGVLLSQGLIVLQWPDAKAGTLANVLLAVAVVIAAGMARFEGRVRREADVLLSARVSGSAAPVREEELATLPAPVQRWLKRSGAVGRPRAHTVRLKQQGQMRLAKDSAWMPVEAEQYFDADAPAFVWSVKTALWRVIPIVGRDRFDRGEGHMLITLAGLLPVADARGAEIDQGTRLRYLGEIIWFPSAALSPQVTWEPIDDSRARATLTLGGSSDSATFTFDAAGRVTHLAAMRFSSSTGRLEPWEIPVRAWKTFDGIEVPSQGDAVWRLSSGDFDYYRWRITRLELDRPCRFGAEPPAPVARERSDFVSSVAR